MCSIAAKVQPFCRADRLRSARPADGADLSIALIGGATEHALAEQIALATSGAVHIRLLDGTPTGTRLAYMLRTAAEWEREQEKRTAANPPPPPKRSERQT